MNFSSVSLSDLDSADTSALNTADFGIVKMTHDGKITEYNDWQSSFAHIPKEIATGRHFFSEVAPCTNNYLVSGRYETNSTLDETMDYVFSLRMRPTDVVLRLLKGPDAQYMLCTKP